jgi:signal transduction histidine kinase
LLAANAAPVGMALLDSRLRVVLVNAAMDRVAGGHLKPGSTLSALSPAAAGVLKPLCRQVLETGETVIEREVCASDARAAENPHCWLATVYPVPGSAPAVTLILSDWTDGKAAQSRTSDARHQESVSRLAGGVAHDFNNILVGVLGGASLALDELPESHPARENLEIVLRSGDRAAELTRKLLAYSGKGRFFASQVDMAEVVQEICAELRPTLPRSVSIVVDAEPRLPTLLAEPVQIQEVVRALVINASEAIGKGRGAIRVHVGLERIVGSRSPDADGLGPGKYVVLQVSDTGCGMDEQTRDRIFEPFFTTKFTGRGLSLAAAQGIARSLGGSIHVSSSPGRGSAFTVYLRSEGRQLTRTRPITAVGQAV